MKEIKTGNMYEKLQKELDKGNAVLVEVGRDYSDSIRYRLVTLENCEYADDYPGLVHSIFNDSCFVRRKKNIVKDMEVYDITFERSITKMLVL